ncbi:MAG: ABC transporter substrate-binding protein [Nitrospirae bacterium]|nr:ABC transporter substrate-binding protein [Nitrospirota bacterium]
MTTFAIAGCKNSGDSTVRIGLIAELTGQIPAVGASCKNGALLAVKEINDAGGIELGGKKYKVELIIEDSASKPEQAASAAQKLITQNNVVAIVGPNSSGNALPASEIAETSKTVLITPWSTNPKTTLDARTGLPKKYVFRACFTDIFEGQVLGKFAGDNLKVTKAAVLYDVASEVLKSQSELFNKSFEENGGKVVAVETYSTGDKDFTAQLTKIKSTQPDIIFLPSYYTDVPLQVQQAHRLGITVPFLGSDAWSTEELIKMCGKDCEGFYFCNHYSASSTNPATRKFVEAYSAQYNGTPDDVAALTYDSIGLLKEAIVKAGKTDREAVREALSAIRDFSGVTGNMRFTQGSGDPAKSAVIMQIKDGKFVWVADVNP